MTDSGLRLTLLTLAITCLSSAGCSILAPRQDPSRFFTLTATETSQAPPQAVSGATRPLTYGLGPITLPPYLDHNAMAIRVSPTEIRYSSTDRWATPLQVGITRVLLENMSTLLSGDRIVIYPWEASNPVDYRIEVEVLRFESTAAGNTQLAARWRIKDGRSGKELAARTFSTERPGATADPAASAAALSTALGELSDELGTAARQMPRETVVHR